MQLHLYPFSLLKLPVWDCIRLLSWTVLSLMVVATSFGQTPAHISYNSENGLATNFVFDTMEDDDGTVLIGSNLGLLRFDGQNFKPIVHVADSTSIVTALKFRKSASGKIYAHIMGGGVFCD